MLAIPALSLAIACLYSRKQGMYHVFTGTVCLEKLVLSGHCCSESEALHHTDAVLLMLCSKKPGGRKPNKLFVSHDQNLEYILLIAWARAFGPERENLRKFKNS